MRVRYDCFSLRFFCTSQTFLMNFFLPSGERDEDDSEWEAKYTDSGDQVRETRVRVCVRVFACVRCRLVFTLFLFFSR